MAIEATQPQVSPHTPPLPHSTSADVIVRNGRPIGRELCGWPFWRLLDKRDRPMAGRRLPHFVAARCLELVYTRRRLSYPIGYKRKPHKGNVFGVSR